MQIYNEEATVGLKPPSMTEPQYSADVPLHEFFYYYCLYCFYFCYLVLLLLLLGTAWMKPSPASRARGNLKWVSKDTPTARLTPNPLTAANIYLPASLKRKKQQKTKTKTNRNANRKRNSKIKALASPALLCISSKLGREAWGGKE